MIAPTPWRPASAPNREGTLTGRISAHTRIRLRLNSFPCGATASHAMAGSTKIARAYREKWYSATTTPVAAQPNRCFLGRVRWGMGVKIAPQTWCATRWRANRDLSLGAIRNAEHVSIKIKAGKVQEGAVNVQKEGVMPCAVVAYAKKIGFAPGESAVKCILVKDETDVNRNHLSINSSTASNIRTVAAVFVQSAFVPALSFLSTVPPWSPLPPTT